MTSSSLAHAPILVSFALVLAAPAQARSGTEAVSIALENLSLEGVRGETVRHQGREAIRLIEADDQRGGGMALVKGLSMRDGVIEVDVAGRKGPYAVADDRGFIGIAFRVGPGGDRFEYVYLRPENGRADDQVRRNHATQYASHPDFSFARMRKEFPERYESYVDLEPGVWTRMRIEITGTRALLFVHDQSQPALVVDDLKLPAAEGGVALWIGAGTEGFFSGLRTSPAIAREEPRDSGLDKLKALEGRWVGPAVWDQGGQKGNVQFEVSYRVTSGGKAVLETMMPGTPGEMVTVYHLDGEDLVLVHYCNSGNQPRMKREPTAEENDLRFRCLGGTNMTEADSHMHSARLLLVDPDHIRGEWSSVKGDVVQWVAEADLERRK
jgi:hypothetical protein